MKVLSTAGDSFVVEPFASVEREGKRLRLKVSYRLYGVKYNEELELSEEAFPVLLAAMVQATKPK